MPQATSDLLHNLADAQSKVFPVSAADSGIRPDTTEDDTDVGRNTLKERANFIRVVLGGWMDSLAQEEGKNGSHATTELTESVSLLSSSILGPRQYLQQKPNALLFRPDSSTDLNQLPSTLPLAGAAVQNADFGRHDLATYLLPRTLRAAACLEAALLSSQEPADDQDDVQSQLWRDRHALRLKLEELLFTIVRVLAESAVRVEWQAKDSLVPGGLGKAREMMNEMISLLRALLPTPATPRPTFPHTVLLFESLHSVPRGLEPSEDELLDRQSLSITVRSALHSRALLLTTLRVLRSLTTACPFLSDFHPEVIDLLASTWPTTPLPPSAKGKERVDDTFGRVLAATLAVVVDVIEHPVDAFANQALALLAPRVVDELQTRLLAADARDQSDRMDVDGGGASSSDADVDAALARTLARLWAIANENVGAEAAQGTLRQTIAGAVVENGERMVDCLMAHEESSELRLACLFTLAFPLFPRPQPSGAASNLPDIPSTATELLPAGHLHALGTFFPSSPSLPIHVPPSISNLSTLSKAAWTALGSELVLVVNVQAATQTTARKRKRDQVAGHPSSDIVMEGDHGGPPPPTAGKRRKSGWMDSVAQVLQQMATPEDFNADVENLESKVLRLNDQLDVLRAIGLLGCARDGMLSFSPSLHSTISTFDEPSCLICDAWAGVSSIDAPDSDDSYARTFGHKPLKGLRDAAPVVLDQAAVADTVRLAFLKTLTRVLRHSNPQAAALDLAGDAIAQAVWTEMTASMRAIRLAAGNVLLAIVHAHQALGHETPFLASLCQRLDEFIDHDRPAVSETTLITVGRLARLAIPQGLLECRCLERFVSRLGHPNTFLKSVIRTQLDQVAHHREIKAYALVQPHFATIAPLLVGSRQSASTLAAALDCFNQPRDSLLRLTREYTLPSLVLHGQQAVIEEIADAAKLPSAVMLTEGGTAAAIITFLYMRPLDERTKGLTFFMRLVGTGVTFPDILHSVRVPLIYALALELGDNDKDVQARAKRALQDVEKMRLQSSSTVDLAVVMKESIVGILSHMNRGLNESTNHRPLREKQRIVRSLKAVTTNVGPAIAGFSPQIMATLQSALETPGLRDVTLEAFHEFITTLKYREIGPFVGTTSATFVRLWPEFSPAGRKVAASTLEYILSNKDGLQDFIQDVADLSGIPELVAVNKQLQQNRKDWTFGQRSSYLLVRIGSENDVVALQALRELKVLMAGTAPQLQQFSAGDSFDHSVGTLVKTLLGAAVKDGPENEQIRNVAFECIGILGALDPDRFEMAPADAPFVVTRDFSDHDESVRFALHLIQHLLIGAYRSTNDTKHQEFLAYAIQELLSFCGFTAELANPAAASSKNVDQAARRRWLELPKWVLETCGPLLGGSFSFKERTSPTAAEYPIYTSTSSYRDWIRIWANDLISKLKGAEVKRIFRAFPPVLHLEDIAVAQHLLPHLVLNALIAGSEDDRQKVRQEIETVLTDQVNHAHQLSENSRLLSAQTVFDLMDHLSRWITQARKCRADIIAQKKTKSKGTADSWWSQALIPVEGILGDIPHVLVGQAALTCKAYARSLLNFESHIVDRRGKGEANLQTYYEHLHECYADLDEPDGMEGISTKIIAPSVLHQIREHESTGRWTSAQSCWEVKLQQKPDDPVNHAGLLRCLRNLGHYDSMRTHIVGIIHSRNEDADWDRILAPFNIEACLIVGDWNAVEDALRIPDIEGPEASFGRVVEAMRQGDTDQVTKAFYDAREQLGSPIVAAGRESYRRVYDSIVHLHILQELGSIHADHVNRPEEISSTLTSRLNARLDSTSPSFRAREPILNMRRTAFRLAPSQAARTEIGELWLETSKIARKSGHAQTAYSAILQARDLDAKYAFLQSAKLLKHDDQSYKAIQEIDNALQLLIPPALRGTQKESPLAQLGPPTPLAKASLRRARWMREAGRLEPDDLIESHREAAGLSPDWESPHYYLGHYYNQMYELAESRPNDDSNEGFAARSEGLVRGFHTCREFSLALELGTKFIYQAMPRMLTIWLGMGEDMKVLQISKEKKANPNKVLHGIEYERWNVFAALNKLMERNLKKLPAYQWLTVLPQLVSRILHQNATLLPTLEKILQRVLVSYPHQGFWAMASGLKSQTSKRARRNEKVFRQAESGNPDLVKLLATGSELVDQLLNLCNHPLSKSDTLSMQKTFPNLYRLGGSCLIIPLQTSLNVSLPADATRRAEHRPFPDDLPMFHRFDNDIAIMKSLQMPRVIHVFDDRGGRHGFLCKPKDDLRKDARLMEFNSMIIKLLKKDSDARNRRLTIRTYSVVPLNEECGLIEWVPNVVVLRVILNKLYGARNISGWSPELKKTFDTIRDDKTKTGERFEKEVLSRYPPVFHEWFLEAFPEPSAWLRARLAYSRTAAVISMVGFVLGLGDRHCENILLDGTTGDTVHVDFNCLFDRGRTFDVGEQVPFRLTTNIIAGMGVTGVEGVFRKASEITLKILRDNKDSLMSVLETFVHDPLVEWNKKGPKENTANVNNHIHKMAKKNLEPISNKLRGLQVTSDPASTSSKEVSIGEQVERLLREARNPKNLGSYGHLAR